MNILPKKRWHVRTKENIARVRKDEAQAAEEEKEKQRRILLAEQESRTEILRSKAREKYDGREIKQVDEDVKASTSTTSASTGHVNFFQDLEDGNVPNTGVNAEHEKEVKDEKEKYEKSIGYLTYLGQGTVESTGQIPWWESKPSRFETEVEESKSSQRSKLSDDPLNTIRRYVGTSHETPSKTKLSLKRGKSPSPERSSKHKKSSKKHKKHKKHKRRRHHSSSSEEEVKIVSQKSASIEQLREERLKREAAESARQKSLLAKLRGEPEVEKEKEKVVAVVKQKYNSQFNPVLARQNYEDDRPKH